MIGGCADEKTTGTAKNTARVREELEAKTEAGTVGCRKGPRDLNQLALRPTPSGQRIGFRGRGGEIAAEKVQRGLQRQKNELVNRWRPRSCPQLSRLHLRSAVSSKWREAGMTPTAKSTTLGSLLRGRRAEGSTRVLMGENKTICKL